VNAILHPVSCEGAPDLLDDFFVRGDFGKSERSRRSMQTVEMLVQFENPAVVNSQPFPDGIPTLHRRIERADPGFIAMKQLTVDVNDQIAISFVEALQRY